MTPSTNDSTPLIAAIAGSSARASHFPASSVADSAPGVSDDLATSSVILGFLDNNDQTENHVDNTPVLVHVFIDGFGE